ncbi:MAG: ABC transporter permease, partial [Mesobacillus sp.]|uniref:ABC transporter permease n=1 Tax=Mesobacillus sp. TaxID=2675271 RepID=UPI003C548C53
MDLFDYSLFVSAIRMVSPILLAALGGALCARVGIFNVGLEGLILAGAFSAIAGNHYSGSVLVAVLCGIAGSVLVSLIFGVVTIKFQANPIVAGIAVNFLVLGLTTFLLRALFDVKGAFYDKNMEGLPKWDLPLIENIPVVGNLVSGHSPLVYLAFLAAILLYIFLYKTVAGFRLLAVGKNRSASKSMGLKVTAIQYGAILMSGVLCGLAGTQLSLGQVTMFTEGMTAGRGFIALVAMMLGQSHPIGILG